MGRASIVGAMPSRPMSDRWSVTRGELLVTPGTLGDVACWPTRIVSGLDVQIGRCGPDAALLGAAIEAERVQRANSAAGQEAVA